MNIISFLGDLLHMISIFILLIKMYAARSCKGISLKTQFLYALVFICRYLDLGRFLVRLFIMLEWQPLSQIYLNFMKIAYISISVFIVYMMTSLSPFNKTYDRDIDRVRLPVLIAPCVVAALLFNEKFSFVEVLYSFSLWLEAVAILPQLYMVQQTARLSGGFVENLTSHYVFALGGYRVLYMLNWIWRYFTSTYYWHPILWVSGTIQNAIYADFFYYYIKCQWYGKPIALPV